MNWCQSRSTSYKRLRWSDRHHKGHQLGDASQNFFTVNRKVERLSI